MNTNISSLPMVFLEKGELKICSEFAGEHPCRRMISIKLYISMGILLKFADYFQNCFL